jgi:isoleucyl-tRNA synthetase
MALVAKPDPAAIGKAYKVLQPKIVKLLEARPAVEIKKALEKGHLEVGVEGQVVTIEPSMVRFEKAMPAEVVRVPTEYGELYLDLRVTPELQGEAYAREIIRRIQQMRKEVDLEVDDFIVTVVKPSKDLAAALESQKDFMARETRSRKLTFTDGPVEAEYVVEWNDVDGHSVTIGVTPLHMSEALRDFTRIPGITVAKAVALFDAGYKSLAAVRAATKQELAAIEGLQPADAVRILDALATKKPPEVSCPTCGAPIGSSTRRCPRCGEPVAAETTAGQGTVPKPSRETAQGRSDSAASRPASEEDASPLRDSSAYLVLEATPDEAQRLFQLAQATGRRGMVITRTFPQKVRERLGGPETPILWLSNVGKEEDTVRPKDLEKLSLAVEQFLAREKGVVLLDAIEYLVTNNNFITVLRLVQSIRDQVAINKGIFLISANPSALDPHQLTLLQKEVDQVIPGSASAPA